ERPHDADGRDAIAAVDADVVARERGSCFEEPDEERLLARQEDRCFRRVVVENLQKIDPVEKSRPHLRAAFVLRAQVHAPSLVATEINHVPPPCRTNPATARAWVRRTRYWTVTCRTASRASISTASVWMRSPNHCCRALCTRNCDVAAS